MLINYNDIKNEYEKIRQNDALKSKIRKKETYEKYPELKSIDDNIFRLFVKIIRDTNDGLDVEDLEEKLRNARDSRIKYLKQNNIKDDYREIQYECNKCKDTGFINGKKCSCYIDKEILLYDNVSNFRKYIEKDNFDNLKTSYYKQDNTDFSNSYYNYMVEQISEIKKLVNNIDREAFNIIFVGPPGTGKTFLARCIGAEALKLKKSVLYLNTTEYVDSLKQNYEGIPLKQFASKADLFILDDLGTEYSSDFSKSELNYIIDKRLNNGLSTIITTNLMKDTVLDRYLDPMCSRIFNLYKDIYLSGIDLRGGKDVN